MNFYEDGTFLCWSFFNEEGTYEKQENGTFLLKVERVFMRNMSSDGLVEKDAENSSLSSYLITPLDENTFLRSELEPRTGPSSISTTDFVYVRSRKESEYIQNNKTSLKDSSSTKENNNSAETQVENVTSEMKNALKSAQSYLSIMPFSYSGLIEQL